jgi:hypothetical protein
MTFVQLRTMLERFSRQISRQEAFVENRKLSIKKAVYFQSTIFTYSVPEICIRN